MKFLSDMISKRKQAEEEGVDTSHDEDVTDFPLPEFSASGEASALPSGNQPMASAMPHPAPQPAPAPPPQIQEEPQDDGSYDWDIEGLDLTPDTEDEPEAPASLDVPAKSVSFEDTLVTASDEDLDDEDPAPAPQAPEAAAAAPAITDVERRLRASIARLPGEGEGEEGQAAALPPAAKRTNFIAQSVRNKISNAEAPSAVEDEPVAEEATLPLEESEAEDPASLLIDPEMSSFDEDTEAEDAFDADQTIEAEFDDEYVDEAEAEEDDGHETLEEAIEVLEHAGAEFDDEDEAELEPEIAEVEEEIDAEEYEDDLESAEAYSPLAQLRAMREQARAGTSDAPDQPVDAAAGMNALSSFFANDADGEEDEFEDDVEAEASPFEGSFGDFEDQIEEEDQPVAEDVSSSQDHTVVEMTAAEEAAAPTEETEDMQSSAPEAAKSDFDDPEIDAIAAPRRRAGGRVKTRLLGFHKPDEANADPISAARAKQDDGAPQFAVGWVVVVKGPGRGASFTLHSGASTIGRGDDQTVRLDFGDTSISRENHAVVAYDDEQKRFFIGHGGKANLVRLDDMPVLSTEPLHHGNIIRIGETSLMFIALCGDDFSWTDGPFAESTHAAE